MEKFRLYVHQELLKAEERPLFRIIIDQPINQSSPLLGHIKQDSYVNYNTNLAEQDYWTANHSKGFESFSAEADRQYTLFRKRIRLESSQREVFLSSVTRIICAHISDSTLDVGLMADKLCMSTSQLNRRTRQVTGCSIGKLIRTIRLHYAARLLAENAATVGEIAASIGYDTQSSFTRSFKKAFGCTPSRFMKASPK